jgi:predicted transcriptional regulator
MDELIETNIARVMEESFPVVTENTLMTTITSMMSNCNAVLVARKGKIVGVITNADMLKMI